MKQAMTGTNPMQPSRMAKVGALMLAGVVSLAPAAAMAELSANIGATSNYVFRGVSFADPAISGGVDYAHESGFYVGTWASNLTTPDTTGPEVELDIYAGFGGDLGGGFSYDVGYLYFAFPGAGFEDADYGEVYGSVSWEYFTAGVAYTLNSEAENSVFVEDDLYYYGGFSYPLMDDWSFGATVGYYDFDVDGPGVDASYWHGQVDLTKSAGELGDFTFSLSYAEDAPASGAQDKILPFVSWSKSF